MPRPPGSAYDSRCSLVTGSGVADSSRSESRDDYSSAVKNSGFEMQLRLMIFKVRSNFDQSRLVVKSGLGESIGGPTISNAGASVSKTRTI